MDPVGYTDLAQDNSFTEALLPWVNRLQNRGPISTARDLGTDEIRGLVDAFEAGGYKIVAA